MLPQLHAQISKSFCRPDDSLWEKENKGITMSITNSALNGATKTTLLEYTVW